ncbi:uncharacterized protein LOC116162089 [Photinus pyralis]|uniref:uncharacterized protein LOC116162089 n=1 Tax=Photinus pyralis TaxID=7054 RepID=UPI00126761D1|nr:uncharacterized protein LOC116162089 [Photinus pyralis]
MSRGKKCVSLALAGENDPRAILMSKASSMASTSTGGFQKLSYDDGLLFESETAIDIMNTPIIIEDFNSELLIDNNQHDFIIGTTNNQQTIPIALSNNTCDVRNQNSEPPPASFDDAENDAEFFPDSDEEMDQNSSEIDISVLQDDESDAPINEQVQSRIVEGDILREKNLVAYSDTESDQDAVEDDIPETEMIESKRKRRKRHEVNESTWNSRKVKQDREKGLKYCGRKKIDGKWRYNVKKDERVLKDRCKCILTDQGALRCGMFTEEDRQQIFKEFWSMSWKEKEIYTKLLVTMKLTSRARGRKVENKSRRKYTIEYYLRRREDRLKVCKKMFTNTLSVGEWTVLNWKKRSASTLISKDTESDNDNSKPPTHNEQPETSNRYTLRQKPFATRIESLDNFFSKLPKMESHYCRASSQKLYLEPLWKSKNQLYQFYVSEWCKPKNERPLSLATFFHTFDRKNLSLFRPKKDECDTCVAYKTGNLTEEDYAIHTAKKEEARAEKEADKNNEKYVFTMDLQSVLLAPKSNVSSLYFKTKLMVHNFTVYNLKSKEGTCYLWNETEGALTSHDFSSIIVDFLLKSLPVDNDNNKIILYSDGCTYQNRNAILANALSNVAILYNITIEQKILEKGHTQMEADSIHSTIERHLRNKNINVPADYVDVCKTARQNPKPYTVYYLDHKFFKNFSSIQFYNSIRPGRSPGDPVVTDIRALQYQPDGVICYKLRFPDEWTPLPIRKNKNLLAKPIVDLPHLYKERLKIKKTKYQHLQFLKQSLTADYHLFYDNLPYDD